MSRTLARAAAVADRRVTGLSLEVLAELIAELGPRWQACRDARLADRPRRRAVGAGARYRLVFIDRLWATLVHLRHGVTRDVLACWFEVSRSTITWAVGEVRPLLADRGCSFEGGSGCAPWPMWSSTWAPGDSSACWMPPRSGYAARPRVGPAGAGSSPARRAPTRQCAGHHRYRRATAVLRTDPPGLDPRSTGEPCPVTSADASTSTPSCARSPD